MKTLKLIAILLTAAVCAALPLCNAAAEEIPEPETTDVTDTAEDEEEIQLPARLGAAGVISSYYVLCTAGNKCIMISSRTTDPNVAAKIGSINIRIQRSNNGTSGWTNYTTVADQLAENASYHFMDSYAVSVPSGYYRVVLTHYAKEKGWFFPKTQSVEQTSVVVYVN